MTDINEPARTEGQMPISYRLLGMLQEEAPDAQAQSTCAAVYNQAVHDGNTEERLKAIMSGLLFSGYSTGNWPWTFRRRGV